MTPGLFLVAPFGAVHKVDGGEPGCTTVAAARIRRSVTPNQCLVYGLHFCDACLNADEWRRLVHRPMHVQYPSEWRKS